MGKDPGLGGLRDSPRGPLWKARLLERQDRVFCCLGGPRSRDRQSPAANGKELDRIPTA